MCIVWKHTFNLNVPTSRTWQSKISCYSYHTIHISENIQDLMLLWGQELGKIEKEIGYFKWRARITRVIIVPTEVLEGVENLMLQSLSLHKY